MAGPLQIVKRPGLFFFTGQPRLRPMDWKTIIDDLTSAGLTLQEIADKCGFDHASSLSRLRSSADRSCSYERGCKLKDLHTSLTRKKARREARP